MPGMDRSGPEGQGPKTGRMQGNCNTIPDNPRDEQDMSFGGGRGRRRGCRNRMGNRGTGRGRGGGRGMKR